MAQAAQVTEAGQEKVIRGVLVTTDHYIRDITIPAADTLRGMYELLGCQVVERVLLAENPGVEMWADEEGMLRAAPRRNRAATAPQPGRRGHRWLLPDPLRPRLPGDRHRRAVGVRGRRAVPRGRDRPGRRHRLRGPARGVRHGPPGRRVRRCRSARRDPNRQLTQLRASQGVRDSPRAPWLGAFLPAGEPR